MLLSWNLDALFFLSVNHFCFTKFLDLIQFVYPPSLVGAQTRVMLFYSYFVFLSCLREIITPRVKNIWRCLDAFILRILNELKQKRSLHEHLWSRYGGQSGDSGHEIFQLDQVESLTNSVGVLPICRQ